MTPLLEVEDLRVRFKMGGGLFAPARRVEAVAGVSLTLESGRVLALVGESGSGKTTFGRAIMGLVRSCAGEVRFEGQVLRALPRRAMRRAQRRMAMMFQDPVASLSPRLTVRRLIAEPLIGEGRSRPERDEEARRLIRLVGLSADLLERYPHQLSGGQARRVGVARALALNPRLIIADEPTAGLDVSVQGDVLNLLRRLQREHDIALLLITHNLPLVRRVSDEVAIMYLGRVLERGPTARVFEAPAHPYTRGLIDAVPVPDPRRRRTGQALMLKGETPSLLQRPRGCEFRTRCPVAQPDCAQALPELAGVAADQQARCLFPFRHNQIEVQ